MVSGSRPIRVWSPSKPASGRKYEPTMPYRPIAVKTRMEKILAYFIVVVSFGRLRHPVSNIRRWTDGFRLRDRGLWFYPLCSGAAHAIYLVRENVVQLCPRIVCRDADKRSTYWAQSPILA